MSPLLPNLDGPVIGFFVQQGRSASGVQTAAAAGVGLAVLLAAVFFSLIIYVGFCFCMKRICEKCGHEPGVLIWIPIANLVPQLTAAKLPIWMIVLFLIPLVNIGVVVMLFWKLCEARSKPGALGLLMLVPLANLGLILYLAFAD